MNPEQNYRIYSLVVGYDGDASQTPVNVHNKYDLLRNTHKDSRYRFVNPVLPSSAGENAAYAGLPTLTTHYDPFTLEDDAEGEHIFLDEGKVFDVEWDYVFDQDGLIKEVIKQIRWYRNDGTRSEPKYDGYDVPMRERVATGARRRKNCVSQMNSDVRLSLLADRANYPGSDAGGGMTRMEANFSAMGLAGAFYTQEAVFINSGDIYFDGTGPHSAYAVAVQTLLDSGTQPVWLDGVMRSPVTGDPLASGMTVGGFIVATLTTQAFA